jgi:hypothetical protein
MLRVLLALEPRKDISSCCEPGGIREGSPRLDPVPVVGPADCDRGTTPSPAGPDALEVTVGGTTGPIEDPVELGPLASNQDAT